VIVDVATLGPLGRLKAPGTWGSAAGLLWWAVVVVRLTHHRPHAWQHELAFDALLVLAAIFLCGVAAFLLKKKDPSEVILDEFVAMPLVFFGNGAADPEMGKISLFYILLGFLLFRLFDITKPLGIKKIEALPGGLGIVMDDVVAALYANLVLQLCAFLFSI
jgi:phosphatidylglycerophosphatase A